MSIADLGEPLPESSEDSKPAGIGPGAAHVHDESFSNNRIYEPSDKHGAKPRVVGGRTVQKAPSNGQAALDMSFALSASNHRRIGLDATAGEFVVFDRTGNHVAHKMAAGGEYHGHVRTWDQLTTEMKKALRDNGLVDERGRITFDPSKWDTTP